MRWLVALLWVLVPGAATAQSGLWMSALAIPGPRYGCEIRMTLSNNLTEEISYIFLNYRYHWAGQSKTDNVLFRDIRPGGKKEEVTTLMMDNCPSDLRMTFVGIGNCFGKDMVRFTNCDQHLDGRLYPSGGRIDPPPR